MRAVFITKNFILCQGNFLFYFTVKYIRYDYFNKENNTTLLYDLRTGTHYKSTKYFTHMPSVKKECSFE